MRTIISIFILLILTSCGGVDTTKDPSINSSKNYLTTDQVEVLIKLNKAQKIDGYVVITDSSSINFKRIYIFQPSENYFEAFDFK